MEIQAAAPLYVFYMKSSLFPQDGPGNGCPLGSFWFLLSHLALSRPTTSECVRFILVLKLLIHSPGLTSGLECS